MAHNTHAIQRHQEVQRRTCTLYLSENYNYLHLSLTHKSAYEKRLVRGAVPKITAPATWKTDSAESSAHKFFELSPKPASI